MLFNRGWNGINIDLDIKNIELFNLVRPNDINLNHAISSSSMEKKLYFYHDKSPINTLNHEVSNYQNSIVKETKIVKTTTLNTLLKKLNFNKDIDYMNVDVEGHEIDVFNGFDLERYKPSVISLEFLDLKMKKLEFRNNDLSRVINSDIYKILNNNNYSLINWLHAD